MYCSAKKDMDRQEFMFFLTGGVGLENKVRNKCCLKVR